MRPGTGPEYRFAAARQRHAIGRRGPGLFSLAASSATMQDKPCRSGELVHVRVSKPNANLCQACAARAHRTPRHAGARPDLGRLMSDVPLTEEEARLILARIVELEIEHSDLDDVTERLSVLPAQDQLQLRRIKKRKLYLKDQIARLRNRLIPDIIA